MAADMDGAGHGRAGRGRDAWGGYRGVGVMRTRAQILDDSQSAIVAAPEFFFARAPYSLAVCRPRANEADARDDLAKVDALLENTPRKFWGVAAQAAMSIGATP